MRLVLDTSVLVAAMRSQTGASKALVTAALGSQFRMLISPALVLEYEAVLSRREHSHAYGLSKLEIDEMLDLICSAGSEVRSVRSWRPLLRDPDDEMVLETAINGKADAIVTFNRADFVGIPDKFRLEVLSPQEALRRVRIK